MQDWMTENNLILINRPDDKPSYFSRAWKKLSTPDIAMASEDIQKRTARHVDNQLGGSDHLPITLKNGRPENHLNKQQEKGQLELQKSELAEIPDRS